MRYWKANDYIFCPSNIWKKNTNLILFHKCKLEEFFQFGGLTLSQYFHCKTSKEKNLAVWKYHVSYVLFSLFFALSHYFIIAFQLINYKHFGRSMIQNSQVARNNLVFKDSTSWNVNSVSMVGNDDYSSFQSNSSSKSYVSRNGQMVEFQNVGNGSKSAEEFFDLRIRLVSNNS